MIPTEPSWHSATEQMAHVMMSLSLSSQVVLLCSCCVYKESLLPHCSPSCFTLCSCCVYKELVLANCNPSCLTLCKCCVYNELVSPDGSTSCFILCSCCVYKELLRYPLCCPIQKSPSPISNMRTGCLPACLLVNQLRAISAAQKQMQTCSYTACRPMLDPHHFPQYPDRRITLCATLATVG